MRMLLGLTVAAAALAGTSAADAAISVYTSQSSFLAALGNSGTDTFDDLAFPTSFASPIARTAGAYGYSAAVTTGGFFAAGSTGDPWLSDTSPNTAIAFSGFTGGVTGIGGLFFNTVASGAFGTSSSITLAAVDASGTITQQIANPTTTSFLGFISTTGMISLTVTGPGGSVYPTINNLVLGGASGSGSAAPEPAGWAMMIGGFGLVGAALRRRTRVTFSAATA